MALTILYRGPLSSCNYDCHYCPFAKRHETAAELKRDREALDRFAAWTKGQSQRRLAILFTPWGEALVRPWYQGALATLSHLAHIDRVAIQTNLSCQLDWTADCELDKLALWCTFHPSQLSRDAFLAQCRGLDERGVRYSVGVVGLRESFDEIRRLRQELPPQIYLWINAFKDQPDYYAPHEAQFLKAIDPLFPLNNTRHPSYGRRCLTGETVISVDGEGNIRRCHFIPQVLGNIFDPNWADCLQERRCTNQACGCHIGYIHMPELEQYPLYGAGLLERIPREAVWLSSVMA